MGTKFAVIAIVCSLSLLISLSSATAGELRVEVAVVATGVRNLEPIGAAVSFPPDVGRVYCFTRIVGAEAPTAIKHVWRRGNVTMAVVPLEIKSASFRTYSYKTILPEWRGRWSVDVVTEKGEILKTLHFRIE